MIANSVFILQWPESSSSKFLVVPLLGVFFFFFHKGIVTKLKIFQFRIWTSDKILNLIRFDLPCVCTN